MDQDFTGHDRGYLFRRFANWFPLGLAYAFFYMGRYNLTVSKTALGDLMTKEQFGDIFGIGALVYGVSFLFSGPVVDRFGGRNGMLFGTGGVIVMNFLMGLVLYGITTWGWEVNILTTFTWMYALNMFFQSFGAISIVTTKAPWFHVQERGKFSTIFGFMISLGVFFAFDWGFALVDASRGTLDADLGFWATLFSTVLGIGNTGVDQNWVVFFVPASLLTLCWIAMFGWLKNSPGEAGFANFETGEESVSENGERLPVMAAFVGMLKHPVIRIVIGIEFCSGLLRNGIMHWYPLFAKDVGFKHDFWISDNWGLTLLVCGMTGAILTGWASDRFFQSRRGPAAGMLYVLMVAAIMIMTATLDGPLIYAGLVTMVVSMAVIGIHGILSGTVTADFGGTKNAGVAVGIVDGAAYLGVGVQSFVIGRLVPTGEAAANPANWAAWPLFLLPFAVLGTLGCMHIWNALPKRKTASGH